MNLTGIAEPLGILVGFTLTLCVLIYIIGDNVLFRLALHVFIGVASGYAAMLIIYNVLWYQLLLPLIQDPLGNPLMLIPTMILGIWLLVKASPRLAKYGSPVVARTLGVGFALLVLPTSLGVTGVVMLLNAALWAPALARILDTSLRYTLDKTTREVLFLPLPTALKYRAKPFVDVTVDRFAKGLAALRALVLIKPWGLALNWQQVSYASLAVMALWVLTAVRARRQYLLTFRRSIERREVEASEVRPDLADPATIEALVEDLAHPDEERVLYADLPLELVWFPIPCYL